MQSDERKGKLTSDERPKHRKGGSLVGQIKGLFKREPSLYNSADSEVTMKNLTISNQDGTCLESMGVQTEVEKRKRCNRKDTESKKVSEKQCSITRSDNNIDLITENENVHHNIRGKSPTPLRCVKKTRFQSFTCFLDAAIEGNLLELQRFLQYDGMNVDICNADGVTALHYAVSIGNYDMVDFLLDNGANPNVVDDMGWTPLHSAAYLGRKDLVHLLLIHNADVEAIDIKGQTVIGLATGREVIQLLTEVALQKNRREWVIALYDFDAGQMTQEVGDELFFSRADRLRIIDRRDADWWLASLEGKKGMIPRRFVQ